MVVFIAVIMAASLLAYGAVRLRMYSISIVLTPVGIMIGMLADMSIDEGRMILGMSGLLMLIVSAVEDLSGRYRRA